MKYPNFILVLVLSFLASCIKDNVPDSGEDKVKTGDVLPDFAVEMNDGNVISTEDVKGKVSVITFFHTLCPDCQAELPVLQNVYEEYSDDDRVMIFAISREENDVDVSEYWEENDITIPYSAQEDRTVYEMFSTFGIPKIYISDREMVVRYIHSDVDMPTADVLKYEINSLINE
ncbi:TlpA disulfide reductase family protein [uncultured Bacteroides sp.]|uniref:TlpA family protein disulfide reductase n=1 Tax=uncultured Bacteroides sp. TaxID=162156 RepID=UPI00262A83D5|nr:TlpA disulfide reductase family protein [uncultured Bacteroides sp.]